MAKKKIRTKRKKGMSASARAKARARMKKMWKDGTFGKKKKKAIKKTFSRPTKVLTPDHRDLWNRLEEKVIGIIYSYQGKKYIHKFSRLGEIRIGGKKIMITFPKTVKYNRLDGLKN